mgnify:CR=1 FL=1
MDNQVRIQKTVYNKAEATQAINTSFQTFVTSSEVTGSITVSEFFATYEELFYEIPIQGTVNSHEYLVNRSSELTGLAPATEDIQPLLDEISQLREQLLQANEQIFNLQQP